MSSSSAPLIDRPDDDVIACLPEGPVSARDFLAAVHALAGALPDGELVLNFCQDRYRFLLAFCAVIARGQVNVLPPNRAPATLAEMRERLGGPPVMHDGALPPGPPGIDVRDARTPVSDGSVPHVPLSLVCTLSFTSGTTGEASEVRKSWRAVLGATALNAVGYLGDPSRPRSVVATVPPQHMFGLETSVFLPLCARVAIHPGKPLFPADVAAALAAVPAPRVLVTTPVHAKALIAATIDYPPVETVLCATAPLDIELAQAIEARFGAELREVYGSTETGTVATRRTAVAEAWTLLPGIRPERLEDGLTRMHVPHLDEAVLLGDLIDWHDERTFTILGRAADMINVAGRRGSLAALNRKLLAVPGVRDGVLFDPGGEDGVGRLAALVVAPGVERETILAALRQGMDEVFLPRPLLQVDTLPRDETGKLPRTALLARYRELRGS